MNEAMTEKRVEQENDGVRTGLQERAVSRRVWTWADTFTENARGEWVPAIPLPHIGLRKKCWDCGAKFWTTEGYRAHYALRHVLDPAPNQHRES